MTRVVEDARREVRYLVTDFSVELVVSKFRDKAEAEGDIYVPDYQRSLAWSPDQQSYFMESLILRVPVPPVFFYDVNGRLEIVDGSQRIRSLVSFSKGELRLRGLEKLEILNGFTFIQLPEGLQRRLNNTPVRSFVLEEGTDESTRIDLFRRLNTSGKRLADAEIRKGVYKGPFLDLVIESAKSDLFVGLTPRIGGKIDPASERQELVTRFYIYTLRYRSFNHDVRRFLDENMAALNKVSKKGLEDLRQLFNRTMMFIKKHYPNGFYRVDGFNRVPRVRFEAVAVGTALALTSKAELEIEHVGWLKSPAFEKLVRAEATNSGPKLRDRVEYVRDQLLK